MSEPHLVSVVIPSRNGASTLPQLLESLFAQQTAFEVEVLVVDSGSRDGTLSILARYPVRIHTVRPVEFDHGAIRNLGVDLAQGDPVVLLTQDAVPTSPHFLRSLVRPFANPRIAGVYGRQVPRNDCDVATRRRLESAPTGRTRATLNELRGRPLSAFPPAVQHDLCTFDNVCSAIRRMVWEEIPFPSVDFGEDVGWAKAVLTAGWAIAYEPTASVRHSHRRSLLYEYRRTRACHRRLHELFGLTTIPKKRSVVRAAAANLRRDMPYVLRRAPSAAERARQLARVAGLSLASPLAQYQGARDAMRARRGGAPT